MHTYLPTYLGITLSQYAAYIFNSISRPITHPQNNGADGLNVVVHPSQRWPVLAKLNQAGQVKASHGLTAQKKLGRWVPPWLGELGRAGHLLKA